MSGTHVGKADNCVEGSRRWMLDLLEGPALALANVNRAALHLLEAHSDELSKEEETELVALTNAAALLVNWRSTTRARVAAREAAEQLDRAEKQARQAEEMYRRSLQAADHDKKKL